jgi:hypothetical protein
VADFTSLKFQLNTGTNAAPVWTDVPAAGAGTGQELRYSDSSAQGAVASASWPAVTRPTSGTAGVDYLYVFTADTTSLGVLGTSSTTPVAYSNTAQYRFLRLNWDNTGTFASAPIFTAYPSTAHGAVTRGDGSVLGGHASDTGGTARSYLKGNAFGRVDSAGVPAAAPTNAPTVTDGSTGSLSPTAGANWLTNFQSLQGDNDYITAPFTPAATTADQWSLIIRLFIGANSSPGVSTPVISCRYTYS